MSKSYQNRKKQKKQEFGRERCKNLSEDEKQRLVEYRKRYCEVRKNKNKVVQQSFRPLAIIVKT